MFNEMLEIFILYFGLIVLLIASYFDFKSREIPDYLSYSFIFLMSIFRLLQAWILKDNQILITSITWFGIFFVIGYLLYRFRMWGGGDAKLLMGCGLYFSSLPNLFGVVYFPNLPLTFLSNLLIGGSIYTILYSFFVIDKKKLFSELKRGLVHKMFRMIITLSIILIILFVLVNNNLVQALSLTLGIIMPISYILLLYAKIVEKEIMIKIIPLSKITEGDWLAEDIVVKGKYICGTKEPEITKKYIEKLKKLGVKKVQVKYGFPFVPSFFIGTVLSFTVGNLLIVIMQGYI